MTDAEKRLIEIDDAISAIMKTGQSYKIADRQLTRADLAQLRAMRKEAQSEIDAENVGGLGRSTAFACFARR